MAKDKNSSSLEDIQEDIKDCYYQSENHLELYEKRGRWDKVIKSRDWSHLRVLVLSYAGVNDSNVAVLEGKQWPQLQDFQLNSDQDYSNHLTEFGFKLLAPKQWPSLINLEISFNRIGFEGAKLLAKIHMPKLRNLYMHGNKIGNQGFKHLCKTHWAELEVFYLPQNKVEFQGWAQIPRAYWPGLRDLTITFEKVPPIVYWASVGNCSRMLQFSTSIIKDEMLKRKIDQIHEQILIEE